MIDLEFLSTRAYNHFHDPLKDWTEAGLNAAADIFYMGRYLQPPVSLILWGLEPGRQEFSRNETGDWSWFKAKESFFAYLNGRDLEGNEIASTNAERQECLACCFLAIGQ